MDNTPPDPANQEIQQAGITNACIARNGIRHVDADQTAVLVGCSTPGVIIPYFTHQYGCRKPACQGSMPRCRLRACR